MRETRPWLQKLVFVGAGLETPSKSTRDFPKRPVDRSIRKLKPHNWSSWQVPQCSLQRTAVLWRNFWASVAALYAHCDGRREPNAVQHASTSYSIRDESFRSLVLVRERMRGYHVSRNESDALDFCDKRVVAECVFDSIQVMSVALPAGRKPKSRTCCWMKSTHSSP